MYDIPNDPGELSSAAPVLERRALCLGISFNHKYLGNKMGQPYVCDFLNTLKSSQNKKDLNDVTAAPLVFFLLLAAEKRHRKWGSCDVIKILLIS